MERAGDHRHEVSVRTRRLRPPTRSKTIAAARALRVLLLVASTRTVREMRLPPLTVMGVLELE